MRENKISDNKRSGYISKLILNNRGSNILFNGNCRKTRYFQSYVLFKFPSILYKSVADKACLTVFFSFFFFH